MTTAELPWKRSASRYCSAPPTVTTSSSDAWKPRRQSLRTYSSVESCESLVTNATFLPAARSAVTASTAPSVGVVADPHAAVEIEQDVVVAGDERGERHAGEFDYPCSPCGDSPSRS